MLPGDRTIDYSTQSQVLNKLVLIVDIPECLAPLDVPVLGLQLPQTLWATLAEEEIEDNPPGLEQERDAEWAATTRRFHGFTARLPSGSVFMGPFPLSDKLLSQYMTQVTPLASTSPLPAATTPGSSTALSWPPWITEFGLTLRAAAGFGVAGSPTIAPRVRPPVLSFSPDMLRNATTALATAGVQGLVYEPPHGLPGHFYLQPAPPQGESPPATTPASEWDYRVALRGITAQEQITVVALVGADGFLYPATLFGYQLEEFYPGRLSDVEYAERFRSSALQTFLVPVWYL